MQALLAMGLLELRPWKPRTVGALGIAASLLNCWMLYPGYKPPPLFCPPGAAPRVAPPPKHALKSA